MGNRTASQTELSSCVLETHGAGYIVDHVVQRLCDLVVEPGYDAMRSIHAQHRTNSWLPG